MWPGSKTPGLPDVPFALDIGFQVDSYRFCGFVVDFSTTALRDPCRPCCPDIGFQLDSYRFCGCGVLFSTTALRPEPSHFARISVLGWTHIGFRGSGPFLAKCTANA